MCQNIENRTSSRYAAIDDGAAYDRYKTLDQDGALDHNVEEANRLEGTPAYEASHVAREEVTDRSFAKEAALLVAVVVEAERVVIVCRSSHGARELLIL
jgi:hypothetical protein